MGESEKSIHINFDITSQPKTLTPQKIQKILLKAFRLNSKNNNKHKALHIKLQIPFRLSLSESTETHNQNIMITQGSFKRTTIFKPFNPMATAIMNSTKSTSNASNGLLSTTAR